MALHAFTHVALRAANLRAAEGFYERLFALDVAFREAETSAGWETLPVEAGWEDAERSGIELGLVMLYRDGFRLALERATEVAEGGRLGHIGVFADDAELERLRAVASEAGCEVVADQPGRALILDDPFGVRWELNSFPYDDPPSLSTGARSGRWLELGSA